MSTAGQPAPASQAPKRAVLKLSGEALASSASDETIDGVVVERIAGEIAGVCGEQPIQLAIVVGGGNIWRGLTGAGAGMDRATADYMGMLATVKKGRVVIFAGGTGNPYFTTDTTAALRAAEIEADIMLKGTHGGVDGLYTADPKTHPDAIKLDEVSFADVLARELRVMDLTAITLCKENGLPIRVFDVMAPGNIRSALLGEPIGTLVR